MKSISKFALAAIAALAGMFSNGGAADAGAPSTRHVRAAVQGISRSNPIPWWYYAGRRTPRSVRANSRRDWRA